MLQLIIYYISIVSARDDAYTSQLLHLLQIHSVIPTLHCAYFFSCYVCRYMQMSSNVCIIYYVRIVKKRRRVLFI